MRTNDVVVRWPDGKTHNLRRLAVDIGSNADVLHHGRGLAVQPFLEHFDDMILSFEVGVCKPDPEGRAQLPAFLRNSEDH